MPDSIVEVISSRVAVIAVWLCDGRNIRSKRANREPDESFDKVLVTEYHFILSAV